MTTTGGIDLQIQSLSSAYASGRLEPRQVLQRVHQRAQQLADRNIWITLLDWAAIEAQLADVEARRAAGAHLPLYGVPFAIKDNIDLSDVPTTAACPSYATTPRQSAPVVAALIAAGAIALGKTNLDQFATGLVGQRSPYGACASAFDARYISGGSSSGSALAVALGLVSFALGTDTAGSGRVPAAFNNVVGLKPTRGLLSTRGLLPACRSLDCVSVFAGNVADAALVFELTAGFDARDPFSRPAQPGALSIPSRSSPSTSSANASSAFRFGVPAKEQLQFFGDERAEAAFAGALDRLRELGGQAVAVDFEPFAQAAALLYQGPWVAERGAAVGEFIAREPAGLDPTVAGIIGGAKRWSAVDGFLAQQRLRELSRQVDALWDDIDVLVVPTTPTSYTQAEVAADPLGPNARLGTYTNFTNLLDLCGLAVPAGFKSELQPVGVTFLGPAFADRALWSLADRLHQSYRLHVGATEHRVLPEPPPAAPARRPGRAIAAVPRVFQSIRLAVVGAHLDGQPLHYQLTELGARLEQATVTSPHYRLFALDGTVPAKPGLVRQTRGGSPIQLEVYSLDPTGFGQFVAQVAQPLCIGNVELASGEWVKGFLCEPSATERARDITELGGWRAYLAAKASE
ncbi:MAG TPA: allophanate hydrolase [Polyangiaceae bacterium]|nr:allophanate hydrolase [Polyangiaceae bacterium]